MTAKERYDEIIQKIEEMVTVQRLQAKDIAEEIAWNQGMTYRDLATVLGFLTGEQLINYIRSRKYQAAYKFLSEAKARKLKMSIAISKALDIADMKEQSSLNKVFKKLFGVTPGEAFYMQDASRMLPPKSWAEISKAWAVGTISGINKNAFAEPEGIKKSITVCNIIAAQDAQMGCKCLITEDIHSNMVSRIC